MTTALDRWDEEGGAQEVAWPSPYKASDLRGVERRVFVLAEPCGLLTSGK